jgi:Flp pilus assembly protein TadD
METIMNFLPLGKTTIKTTIAATVLAVMASPALAADANLQFSVDSNATRSISASATAFKKGDYRQSIAFSSNALKQGLKKTRKATAYSNLCAALGAEGELELAKKACDQAVEANPRNWQALSNRAVINALVGDQNAAIQDIDSAILLAADEPKLTHNKKLLG